MCVLHATVLHFCDVLTDILSMWVTLLAMACLPHQVRSVLHMVGTIAVAMAVNQDSNSSFTFLVPSLLGTAIMLVSWFWRCTRDKSCYPSMKYLSLYCLPGLLIGGTGVGCLTFQTSLSMSRYQHSLWHLARGVTIMLLLPDTPRTGGKLYCRYCCKCSAFLPRDTFIGFLQTLKRCCTTSSSWFQLMKVVIPGSV